jgi:hypothetical protein
VDMMGARLSDTLSAMSGTKLGLSWVVEAMLGHMVAWIGDVCIIMVMYDDSIGTKLGGGKYTGQCVGS